MKEKKNYIKSHRIDRFDSVDNTLRLSAIIELYVCLGVVMNDDEHRKGKQLRIQQFGESFDGPDLAEKFGRSPFVTLNA